MLHFQKLIVFFVLLSISMSVTFALSADEAVTLISVTNNYLLTGETTSVINHPITYQSSKYIIVAANNSSTVTAYIPIKDSTATVATLDLEIRELIKTSIIFTKMMDLKNNTTPANWPFSYSTKSFMYDLGTDFTSLANDIVSTQTILNAIGTTESKNLAGDADTLKIQTDALIKKSRDLSSQIEASMAYETGVLSSPDTNKMNKYETNYTTYFTTLASYKQDYVALTTDIATFNQALSALDPSKLTADQQKSYQLLLTKVPLAISKATRPNPAQLDSYFNTNDQIRTLIEAVFSAGRANEPYATTLASRKTRSEAWKAIYGTNETLLKIDPSFTTLEKASTALLATENIDQWADQEAVTALGINWNGAVTRFNNAEYDKAKDFAAKANTNIKQIITGGTISTVNTTGQDLIIKIIAALIIIVIGLFIYERFIKKKKPIEESYNEP